MEFLMPIDDETQVFLRGAYEYLQQHQKTIQTIQIVTFALQKAFRELGPQAEKLYEKHYRATLESPLGTQSRLAVEDLAQLIAQLSAGEPN